MKRFALVLLMACLMAAPAYAVQVGHLPADDGGGSVSDTDQPRGHNDDRTPEGVGEENPTRPVPEPTTMALAALSAAAIGAVAKKRRNNKK
jgi:hypothetical protein